MFIRNIFLTSLAVAGLASVCQANENLINSAADAAKIAECTTLSGDLIIGEELASLDLNNLQEIKGSLIADKAENLVTINLSGLAKIGRDFKLRALVELRNLNCQNLTTVEGIIEWITLPNLNAINFQKKVTKASSLRISDTQLTSLDGIDLVTAQRFHIDNNKYLKSVSVGLKNVSEALSMEFNSKSIEINFHSLVWANNITLIDVTSISLPSLVHVNGSMNFNNNSIKEISCKNLTIIEQTLGIIGNSQLTELDFPELKEIGGGFKIHNNTELSNIDGFPKLETVRGAIDFVGNFNNATLPKLEDVQGSFNLQTTEVFNCDEFEQYRDDKVIKGDKFTCLSEEENPETADGKPGADNKDGSNNSGKDNSSGRFGVTALLGLSFAVAIFVL
ncbi:hypothetical protein BDZ91DRAFT_824268 [Kalaharituber pfeilii]|nr:hypothetical protein BDZ91DRAFT_824268 [Kalaharituber pfeilii]